LQEEEVEEALHIWVQVEEAVQGVIKPLHSLVLLVFNMNFI
jgi:hypothetical protein